MKFNVNETAENILEKDYTVEGKLVNLKEFKEAVPNLMNDTVKINKIKGYELIKVTNGFIKDGAERQEVAKSLQETISGIRSSHNRKVVSEIVKMLESDDSKWDDLMKRFQI